MSRGPIVTLVAVLGLGVVLLGANTGASYAGWTTGTTSAAAAPATAADATTLAFVGSISSTAGPIPMTITVDDGRATAALCAGRRLQVRMQGGADGDDVDARADDGSRTVGHMDGDRDRIRGTVHLAGHGDASFDLPVSRDPSAAPCR